MWLLRNRPIEPKRCDYCNGGFGLMRRRSVRGTFCKLQCESMYLDAVYRPPDQYELPLYKPPDALVTLLRYP